MLNILVSSSSPSVEFLWFYLYRIILSTSRNNLTSWVTVFIHLIFLCLMALANPSRTTFNMMPTVGLSFIVYIVLRYVSFILSLLKNLFYYESIIRYFLCIYLYNHLVFSFNLLMWYIMFIDLNVLNHPYIPDVSFDFIR